MVTQRFPMAINKGLFLFENTVRLITLINNSNDSSSYESQERSVVGASDEKVWLGPARYARNEREHPGGCDCCQLSLNVFHRGILCRYKKPHKGRERLV